MGQALEKRQLRRTGAAAGSASERIAKREKLDENRKNKKYVNTEAQTVDKVVVGATNEELEEYQMLSEVAQASGKLGGGKRAREKAIKKYASKVTARSGLDKLLLSHVNRNPRQLSVKDYETIMNEVVEGEYRQSINIIMSSGAFPEEFKKTACEKIIDTAKQIKETRKKARNFRERAQQIKDETGVDVTSKGFGRVINQEIKDRGLDQAPSKEEEKTEKKINDIPDILKDNHTEAMTALNRIADAIEVVAYPDKKKAYKRKLKAQRKAARRAKQDAESIARDEYDEDEEFQAPAVVNDGSTELANANVKGVDTVKNKLTVTKQNRNMTDEEFAAQINISDVVAAANAGDFSFAQRLANGAISKASQLRGAARNLVNRIRRKSNKSNTVMTDARAISELRTDSHGNEIPDERDSETKETLAIRDEQRQTQKGILSKISSLGDGLKGLLGFGKDDEDDEEGFFSKIIGKVAKYALPVLAGVGELLG